MPSNPSARKVTFKSKTKTDPVQNRVVVPAQGRAGDPTVDGATLVVYNSAGSGEKATVALPGGGLADHRVAGALRGAHRFGGLDRAGPISRSW